MVTSSLSSRAFLDRDKYFGKLGYSIGEEERIILRTISPHVQKQSLNELLLHPKLELEEPSEAGFGWLWLMGLTHRSGLGGCSYCCY